MHPDHRSQLADFISPRLNESDGHHHLRDVEEYNWFLSSKWLN